MTPGLRVLRCAAASAWADLGATYTWRTWTFGWLARIVAQVSFFALIGRLVGSQATARYLAVGNAVMVAAMVATMVVASTTWERRTGTLPLLVAAPTTPTLVFAGRSVQWLVDGTAAATVSFFAVGAMFGVPVTWPGVLAVVPLIALVAVATYCFGLVFAGLVLRAMEVRNVVSNAVYLSLMALTGVEVPTSYWPAGVRAVTAFLPVTHGLAAVRGVLAGMPASEVARLAGLEAAVGLGWLGVAALVFNRLAESGRRDGSIEFG